MTRVSRLCLGILALALAAHAPPASSGDDDDEEDSFEELGELGCRVYEKRRIWRWLGMKSERPLDCTFEPLLGEPAPYTGVLKNYGIDLKADSELRFQVFAQKPADAELPRHPLVGHYRGLAVGLGWQTGSGEIVKFVHQQGSVRLEPLKLRGAGVGGSIGGASLDLRRP